MTSKVVRPHVILLIYGRLFFLAGLICVLSTIVFSVYDACVGEAGLSIMMAVLSLAFMASMGFCWHYLGQACFGILVVNDDTVEWRCVFHSRVKLKRSEIRYVDIRKIDGNVMPDLYNTWQEYLLISAEPLPRINVQKIRSGNNLIKFQLSPECCEILGDFFDPPRNRMFLSRLEKSKKPSKKRRSGK